MSSEEAEQAAPLQVGDYRDQAESRLPRDLFDYIDGAAGDEITLDNNKRSLDAIRLRPFCLRDVSTTSTASELLGQKLTSPILIGPTAFHQFVNAGGEVATAKAARDCGLPMIASSMSSFSLEEIAQQSAHDSLWLQCYILKQRDLTKKLLERAATAGYKAVVLTVNAPVHGTRYRDLRNHFRLPADCRSGNFPGRAGDERLHEFAQAVLDPSVTWHDVEWLRSLTSMPVFLKGVLNPGDAHRAREMGLGGIIVSNHGGRQLDTAQAPIQVLPEIAATVDGAFPILIDGGITRGTDIVKALALGADAVLLGRPILWALAVAGEEGVRALLEMLKTDFDSTMKLCGCRTVEEIRRSGTDLCVRP